MKKAIAMADNCIDVYYRMDRYYLTGNSIDFALNYKAQGGDVTEMTVLGNDVFADALVERLKQRDIPLRVLKRIDRPTGMAKMDLVDGDKKHLEFHGNAMEEIELSAEDMEFVKGFDIVYAERCASRGRSGSTTFRNDWSSPPTTRFSPIWITPFSPTTRMMTISGNLCAARKRRAQAV